MNGQIHNGMTSFKLSNGIYLRSLRLSENSLARKIFGPKSGKLTGEWGRWLNADGMFRTHRQVSLGLSFQEGEMGVACDPYEGRRDVNVGFWW